MKYIIDHDLHIHSQLSLCSQHPEQTPERILRYARETGLKKVCLTDHYWDEQVPGASEWYAIQNTAWIEKSLPLPQAEGIEFLFGCETDLSRDLTVGVAGETFDRFDFVIIPTTHLHMDGFTISREEASSLETRASLWVSRLDGLLDMDLPFEKIGIAHPVCPLCVRGSRETYLEFLKRLPEKEMYRLFTKAAALGVGIELNSCDMSFSDEETDTVLRPFRIAKECGCSFYLGSDAHTPEEFAHVVEIFTRAVELLDLKEEDKFRV